MMWRGAQRVNHCLHETLRSEREDLTTIFGLPPNSALIAPSSSPTISKVGTPKTYRGYWLLSVFINQCRTIGAIPETVCRP